MEGHKLLHAFVNEPGVEVERKATYIVDALLKDLCNSSEQFLCAGAISYFTGWVVSENTSLFLNHQLVPALITAINERNPSLFEAAFVAKLINGTIQSDPLALKDQFLASDHPSAFYNQCKELLTKCFERNFVATYEKISVSFVDVRTILSTLADAFGERVYPMAMINRLIGENFHEGTGDSYSLQPFFWDEKQAEFLSSDAFHSTLKDSIQYALATNYDYLKISPQTNYIMFGIHQSESLGTCSDFNFIGLNSAFLATVNEDELRWDRIGEVLAHEATHGLRMPRFVEGAQRYEAGHIILDCKTFEKVGTIFEEYVANSTSDHYLQFKAGYSRSVVELTASLNVPEYFGPIHTHLIDRIIDVLPLQYSEEEKTFSLKSYRYQYTKNDISPSVGYSSLMYCLDSLAAEIYPDLDACGPAKMFRRFVAETRIVGSNELTQKLETQFGSKGMKFLMELSSDLTAFNSLMPKQGSGINLSHYLFEAFAAARNLPLERRQEFRDAIYEIHRDYRSAYDENNTVKARF